jgi:hypothetical protein
LVARVTWSGRGAAEVTVRHERARIAPAVRHITFREDDPARERWRALGLVVAAAALEQARQGELLESEEEERDASDREIAVDAVPRDRLESRERPSPLLWIDAGQVMGPGLDNSGWGVGGWVEGGGRHRSLPIGAALSASYIFGPRDERGARGKWLTLLLAAGPMWGVRELLLDVRLRLGLAAQSVRADVDSEEGEGATGDRWVFGLGGGADLAWPNTGRVSAVLGFQGWRLSGGTAVQLQDEPVGSFPALGYAVRVGVEFHPLE